jgi:hypothetical protein
MAEEKEWQGGLPTHESVVFSLLRWAIEYGNNQCYSPP